MRELAETEGTVGQKGIHCRSGEKTVEQLLSAWYVVSCCASIQVVTRYLQASSSSAIG